MNDRFLDQNDFLINHMRSSEIKPGITQLHLPENLQGMSVLELYSGDEKASLQSEIARRGGLYTSVDITESVGDFHFNNSATEPLPFLPNSFDYILMAYPPLWKSNDQISLNYLMKILHTCLPVLKKVQGKFIGILTPMDKNNVAQILDFITKDPKFADFEPYAESTTWPLKDSQGNIRPGSVYTFRLIKE